MTNSEERMVKTLLLAKVTADGETDYCTKYKSIYAPGENDSKYITLGGFDALSVYQIDSESQWLKRVLEDKQTVIKNTSNMISYHPIHLVSYGNRIPAKDQILLVVFVYGVTDQFEKLGPSSLGNADNTEVFHCINISDRVILHYTDDIRTSLLAIRKLKEDGLVRKTYTTVNFPMDKTGAVEPKILNCLKTLEPLDKIDVLIQGSIRVMSVWQDICTALQTKIIGFSCNYNYGEADFTITGAVTYPLLADLLEYFTKNSKNISEACWSIHTELQTEESISVKGDGQPSKNGDKDTTTENGEDEKKIGWILEKEYDRFLELFEENRIFADNNYPWRFALKELFTAQLNIDKHPLLHGPVYVLYDFLHIMNEYFVGATKQGQIGDIEDTNKIEGIIQNSQNGIERMIRCLSQLTDQLTRNDDVIFRGLGRVPAIATTLPENLLEFYHAFFRNLADYLIEIDKKFGFVKEKTGSYKYEYGFLLAPELNQRMRISPLFHISYSDKTPSAEITSWPQKQAYIIQLPSDDIFRPMDCFFPLAHECFHIFGDKLRFRKARFHYMAMFVAATFIASLGMDEKVNEPLFWLLVDELIIYDDSQGELYLEKAQAFLVKNAARILSYDGIETLNRKVKMWNPDISYRLYSRENIESVRGAINHFCDDGDANPDVIATVRYIDGCKYFFKECYADVMAIETLGVTLPEYLERFQQELSLFDHIKWNDWEESTTAQCNLLGLCQRISIVCAVMLKCDSKKLDEDFQRLKTHSLSKECYSIKITDGRKIGSIIGDCIDSLIHEEGKVLQPVDTTDKDRTWQGVYPVHALTYVVDYLVSIITDFYRRNEEIKQIEAPDKSSSYADWLKQQFDALIRKEQFFSTDFNNVVMWNRHRIENEANDFRNQHGPAKD